MFLYEAGEESKKVGFRGLFHGLSHCLSQISVEESIESRGFLSGALVAGRVAERGVIGFAQDG